MLLYSRFIIRKMTYWTLKLFFWFSKENKTFYINVLFDNENWNHYFFLQYTMWFYDNILQVVPSLREGCLSFKMFNRTYLYNFLYNLHYEGYIMLYYGKWYTKLLIIHGLSGSTYGLKCNCHHHGRRMQSRRLQPGRRRRTT